ncbi:proton-conducting transporter transmembrane domain-containing protein [Halorussus salinisoli]|uniref:proton-conducting transporter transmembrane domain-containing protein n=1 Tax=Halorussus salinisoli TaxID=2558242 RepID=UPI0010C185F6|nr:proton-conducting transporter membrane subunit [Halorussus salinisoli]
MSEVLAALVAVPISAAVLPPIVGRIFEDSGWPIATAALVIQTALAGYLGVLVVKGGTLSYGVGGFTPPVGIELVADGLSAPFVLLVAVVSVALTAYTRIGGPRSNPFYSLYLLLVAGLTGVCVTGDVFNLYVFLEISGLAAYALVARASGGRAALAALKYLLLGTVGATLYLLGVGYLYVATGTLNMVDLATHLPRESTLTLAAFAFIGVGLAVKMALYPLHVWQPDAYEHAPAAVSVLLSALVSTVAGYALIRLVFGVFTVRFFAVHPIVDEVILLLAGVSVIAGGVLASRQSSVKRIFAYSSVAQFGLATVGIGLGTVPAVVGAVVQLLGHAVMKGGLFAAAGVVASRTGAASVEEYAGLGQRAPWASGSLAVIGLGMVGIPPTVGFVAKWYIAVGAIEAGSWSMLVLVLVSTLLSLTYFGTLVQQLYVRDDRNIGTERNVSERHASFGMRAVAVGAAVATVGLGFAAIGIASLVEPTVTALVES